MWLSMKGAQLKKLNRISKVLILAATSIFVAQTSYAQESSSFKLGADLYGTHSNLMPYKGYQDDLSATLYLQYKDFLVVPFVRYVDTNYYYLNEAGGNTAYTSDHRTAAGGGLDIRLLPYLKLRLISEYITNKLSSQSYSQDSYGLIYNQYIEVAGLEFNNYLESFYIPRASNSIDTFARVQLLKNYYVTRSNESSNALFPFVQVKAKINDDAVFGVSGQNASVGAGYKYFRKFNSDSSLALLLEGHSVIYQSRDFNGDWMQALAAIQFLYN